MGLGFPFCLHPSDFCLPVLGMSLAEAKGLRGYDAVPLAAGYAVNALCLTSGLPPFIFVSADNELNAAASNEGLIVENPNDR